MAKREQPNHQRGFCLKTGGGRKSPNKSVDHSPANELVKLPASCSKQLGLLFSPSHQWNQITVTNLFSQERMSAVTTAQKGKGEISRRLSSLTKADILNDYSVSGFKNAGAEPIVIIYHHSEEQ